MKQIMLNIQSLLTVRVVTVFAVFLRCSVRTFLIRSTNHLKRQFGVDVATDVFIGGKL